MDTNIFANGKRLTRSRDERMIAGVAGGLARHLDIDATLVRLGFGVLTLISLGVGLAVYVLAWIIIPEEA